MRGTYPPSLLVAVANIGSTFATLAIFAILQIFNMKQILEIVELAEVGLLVAQTSVCATLLREGGNQTDQTGGLNWND